MTRSLRRLTVVAAVWSAIQSWGMKLLALVVFFFLARYLTPSEMGLAQSVILLLAFIAIVSEQGFSDAIVQRKSLEPDDLNWPFVVSMAIALVASAALLLFSAEISRALHADHGQALLLAAAVIPPLTAANMLITALYRRQLDFKTLTRASLSAGCISGSLAVALAVQGLGAASLVVQAVIVAMVTSLMLWRKPIWKPSLRFKTSAFRDLLSYSTSAFGSRLLDFFSGKILDLIVLSRFGLAGLGMFTVGSKLYLTLLNLLASALVDVALSAMSRTSSDKRRLQNAYLRFIFIASCTTAPLFVGVAAIAPEICFILFGPQWAAAADVLRWLCLLGALQVVQFFNSSVLGATGRARQILVLNALKFSMGAVALYVAKATTISELVLYFAASQLLATPVSFFLGMRASETKLIELIPKMLPGLTASAAAYSSVAMARFYVSVAEAGVWISAGILLSLYGLVVMAVLGATSATELRLQYQYIKRAW